MSRSTGSFLLVLGLLAAGALVFWALDDGDEQGGYTLEGEPGLRDDPPDGGSTAVKRDTPEVRESAEGPLRDGVSRVLPPDAAIEDVRDALARSNATRRARDLQAAYEGITRIVQDAGVAEGIEVYVQRVEDPVARSIVHAALGANRDKTTIAWLTQRLRDGPTTEDRIGAFLGLVYERGTRRATCRSLGSISHAHGALPKQRVVLEAVAAFLDRVTADEAPDVVVPLTYAVQQDADVAALLVVDGARPCKLYTTLEGTARGGLRDAALEHAALPGVVRRVLEASR